MTDYWSKADNFDTAFYGNAMPRNRSMHILRFLHFTDNKIIPDMKVKIRTGYGKLEISLTF